jgi:glutamate racemase
VSAASTNALLERHLAGVRESGADVVGLGCTHYPFLRQQIKRILGPGVRVYDPSKPVARRVRDLLAQTDGFASPDHVAEYSYYTTGDPKIFKRVASKLLRLPVTDVGFVELDVSATDEHRSAQKEKMA